MLDEVVAHSTSTYSIRSPAARPTQSPGAVKQILRRSRYTVTRFTQAPAPFKKGRGDAAIARIGSNPTRKFPPLEKGGRGDLLLPLFLSLVEQEQEQIPLTPLFQRGERDGK